MNLELYNLQYDQVYFLDDDERKHQAKPGGVEVKGSVAHLHQVDNADVVIGIAFPGIKRKILSALGSHPGLHFPTLISARSWLSNGVEVGKGTIIYPGCSINYGTRISDFVVMNMNCALGHDITVGAFSALAPGVNLAGHTFLDEGVDMGIGAATRQQVRVGKDAVIGGQCMLVRDVPPGARVAGVPGRLLANP